MTDSPSIVKNGPKRGIGVLTSGGDAQGMNSAVRAVVRSAISMGANVFGILNGYQGMVDDKIRQLFWGDVADILSEGGTFIGTARCAAFMTREGRKQGTLNLLRRGVDRLIVIGGDGSLTGASKLHSEWKEFVEELKKESMEKLAKKEEVEPNLLPEVLERHSQLTIVGLVGSIDNDMPGTDFTIGADSALNQIIHAVDSLMSTAASHQREFVVEVMGRNCGWLALMGALATGADWIIIPEIPPDSSTWKEKMCKTIKKGKQMGRRSSIVIIAEGARDQEGKPISSQEVKEALDKGGFDARITVLGHVQRGGSPTAWDRNSSIVQAVRATRIALSDERKEPLVVGVCSNKITETPLRESLATIQKISEAIKSKNFETAKNLRGKFFIEGHQIMKILTRVRPSKKGASNDKKLRIGVMHAGACSPGMNAAVRAVTRLSINHGHTILAIQNGFDGLLKDEVQEYNWMSVNGWAKQGGARLGARRVPGKLNYKAVDEALAKHKIEALVIIGGWDGYEAVLGLDHHKKDLVYAKNVPFVLVPASISNNLPCTDFSIGSDTSLNTIIECVDKIKQSAVSSNRVFVVEVMGTTGYLALMSALATGAEKVYIPEEPLTLPILNEDIQTFVSAFKHSDGHAGLVINNESASKVFNTTTLAALYEDQSHETFAVRTAVLGHMQQGGAPSAYDRVFAAMLAFQALHFVEEQSANPEPQSGCVGMVEGDFKSIVLSKMETQMDHKNRRPKEEWWMPIRNTMKLITFLPEKVM